MKEESSSPADVGLSRRERQIMDAVYGGYPATAREIHRRLVDPPGYSTVRKQLSVLIEKSELKGRRVGRALVYEPVRSRESAAKSAIHRLVETFFGGSLEAAVTGLINAGEKPLTAEEAATLRQRIAEAAVENDASEAETNAEPQGGEQ
jgi:predicted transcriptional regulator